MPKQTLTFDANEVVERVAAAMAKDTYDGLRLRGVVVVGDNDMEAYLGLARVAVTAMEWPVWRPIESAPRDGTLDPLLFDPEGPTP